MTNQEIQPILKQMQEEIQFMLDNEEDMNTRDWGYQEGILLTGNQAKKLLDYISRLQNHTDYLADQLNDLSLDTYTLQECQTKISNVKAKFQTFIKNARIEP